MGIAGKMRQMQTAYSNYVIREMGKAETMLKVLTSPDVDASAVSALLGEERFASGFQAEDVKRLLALRAGSNADAPMIDWPREDDKGGSAIGDFKQWGGGFMSAFDALASKGTDVKQKMEKSTRGFEK